MATYKVLQDIEAEDKFVGPLTLKQFIFISIAAINGYLSFVAIAKRTTWMLAIFVPIMAVMLALGFPWGRDQPTEIWLAAKLRFYFKPRKRIWDQSGIQELVTITAPKTPEKIYTNGLNPNEVRSRLHALADTLDSRGWAIKNVNVNLYDQRYVPAMAAPSDRLLDMSAFPQEVSNVDVMASDDIMDEQNNPVAHQFDTLIKASGKSHRQQLLDKMKQMGSGKDSGQAQSSAAASQDNFWFMQQPATPPAPGYASFSSQSLPPADDQGLSAAFSSPASQSLTSEEAALLNQIHAEQNQPPAQEGHLKIINPLGSTPPAPTGSAKTTDNPAAITSRQTPDPAILELANNDDLNVATIARQANKAKEPKEPPEDELVISLH